MHVFQARVIRDQRFTERIVQRINWTVAFRRGVDASPVNLQLDESFGYDWPVGSFLYQHLKRFEDE
ncbi:hypothetical protein D3C81_1284050 [compost metagenome]